MPRSTLRQARQPVAQERENAVIRVDEALERCTELKSNWL